MPWIFTHGSLMSRPPFEFRDRAACHVHGWRRTFGHPSVRNWGRPGRAAPTCALVAGGSVAGVAYDVADAAIARVQQREALAPVVVTARMPGRSVDALTWPMTSPWSTWSPRRLARAAQVNVASGGGPLGDAVDYVAIVHVALAEHGLHDPLVSSYRGALAGLGLPLPAGPGAGATGVPIDGSVE